MGRFHGLDACRAAAMMLGLFFHGAISFLQTNVPWAIRDRSTSFAVDVFVWVCHTFRMPVFFLLAGFFGRLLFVKLGPKQFLRHRAKRILIPFVVTLVPLMPTLFLLWRWGGTKQPRTGAWPGMEATSIDPGQMRPSPGHLWFLYYLMMILAALVIAALILRRTPPKVDGLVRVMVRWSVVPLVMAIPTAATLWPMVSMSADTPVDFVPVPRILIYYFVFSGFGWLLHRQADLVEHLGRRLWIPLVLALATLAPIGILVERAVRSGPLEPPALRLAGLYLGALFGWSMIVLFMGAFVKWGEKPRAWVSWLSDASYWCYLVHLPVVVALQILVSDWTLPGLLKYAVVMTGTLAACLGSYHAFVRYTFLGAALNGPRERPAAAPVTP